MVKDLKYPALEKLCRTIYGRKPRLSELDDRKFLERIMADTNERLEAMRLSILELQEGM